MNTTLRPTGRNAWINTDYGRTHCPVNVSDAIKVPATTFSTTWDGWRASTPSINIPSSWAGRITGIEIAGSPKGFSQARNTGGKTTRPVAARGYHPGRHRPVDNNQFTPLQLANYGATVANGGTRIFRTIFGRKSEIPSPASWWRKRSPPWRRRSTSQENYNAIRKGMPLGYRGRYGVHVFGNYPIAVGAKRERPSPGPADRPTACSSPSAFQRPGNRGAAVVNTAPTAIMSRPSRRYL